MNGSCSPRSMGADIGVWTIGAAAAVETTGVSAECWTSLSPVVEVLIRTQTYAIPQTANPNSHHCACIGSATITWDAPDATSHSLAVPSSPPVARVRPSGANSTDQTQRESAVSVWRA